MYLNKKKERQKEKINRKSRRPTEYQNGLSSAVISNFGFITVIPLTLCIINNFQLFKERNVLAQEI